MFFHAIIILNAISTVQQVPKSLCMFAILYDITAIPCPTNFRPIKICLSSVHMAHDSRFCHGHGECKARWCFPSLSPGQPRSPEACFLVVNKVPRFLLRSTILFSIFSLFFTSLRWVDVGSALHLQQHIIKADSTKRKLWEELLMLFSLPSFQSSH